MNTPSTALENNKPNYTSEQLSAMLPIIEVHILRTANSQLLKEKMTYVDPYVDETHLDTDKNSENLTSFISDHVFSINALKNCRSEAGEDTCYQWVSINQLKLLKYIRSNASRKIIDNQIHWTHELTARFVRTLIGILPEHKPAGNFTMPIQEAIYIAKRSSAQDFSHFSRFDHAKDHALKCASDKSVQDMGVELLHQYMYDDAHGCSADPGSPVIDQYWISDKYNAPEGVSAFSFKEEDIDRIISVLENQL